MSIFNFIIGVLATIRLSTILEVEKIAFPIRDYFGIGHNAKKEPRTPSGLTGIRGFFGDLLWCWKCISVWVGGFFALLYMTNRWLYKLVALTLTFSYLAFELSGFWSKVKSKV